MMAILDAKLQTQQRQQNHMPYLGISKSEAAVEMAVMLVCFPMRNNTSRFWTTSSLVGHTQRAWGECKVGSTLLSMAKTKQVVFPLPL